MITLDKIPQSERDVLELECFSKLYHRLNLKVENEHVVELKIHSSKLNSLPESIDNLKFLRMMSLDSCGLQFLPENFGTIPCS